MRTQPAVMVLLASVLSSCGSDEQKPPRLECTPGAEVPGPSGTGQAIRGSVSLLDRRDRTLDDMGRAQDLVQSILGGTFADFSTVTSTPSARMLFGDTCVGIVSRPVSSGQARRLDLASLTVKGTAIGDVGVTRTSTGVFRKVGTELLMPGATSIRIVAETEMDGFPAFDEALTPVAAIDLIDPLSDGTALLLPDDLPISWTPADGDFILVSVVPEVPMGMMSTGGQVTCVAADDGCFILPASAATFLLASQTDFYTLSLERHRYRATTAGSGVGLELDAASEIQVTLANGVFAP